MLSRCRKSARPCGAKHIPKSKVRKTVFFWLTLRCQLTNLTSFSHSTNNYNNYKYYNYNNTTTTTTATTTTTTTRTNTTITTTKITTTTTTIKITTTQLHFIALQLQLQLQLHLHCAASNHFSIHQWICSAIHDSQQPTSYSLLSLKLPPAPCAVDIGLHLIHVSTYLPTYPPTYLHYPHCLHSQSSRDLPGFGPQRRTFGWPGPGP